MEKAVEYYGEELKTVRTSRPNPSMLDKVVVEVYGTEMRMRDIATISIGDGNQLIITPFDSHAIHPIAKGIKKANLNLMPTIDGYIVRVPIPPMSEQRRKEIAKDIREKGEKTKVTIRDMRRKANDRVKKERNDGTLSEDEQKKQEKSIQELTDKYCHQIEKMFFAKEKDILEV